MPSLVGELAEELVRSFGDLPLLLALYPYSETRVAVGIKDNIIYGKKDQWDFAIGSIRVFRKYGLKGKILRHSTKAYLDYGWNKIEVCSQIIGTTVVLDVDDVVNLIDELRALERCR